MADAVKMRANRKALETKCTSCGREFAFGADIYSCGGCGGFHHATCWESGRGCAGVAERTAGAAPHAEAAPAGRLAEDERLCLSCQSVVKRDALQCRFCGRPLDARFAASVVPPAMEARIRKLSNQSLGWGIAGVATMCIGAPLCSTLAIVQGGEARGLRDRFPQVETGRGKQQAGIVLGWVGWAFFALFVILGLLKQS